MKRSIPTGCEYRRKSVLDMVLINIFGYYMDNPVMIIFDECNFPSTPEKAYLIIHIESQMIFLWIISSSTMFTV